MPACLEVMVRAQGQPWYNTPGAEMGFLFSNPEPPLEFTDLKIV